MLIIQIIKNLFLSRKARIREKTIDKAREDIIHAQMFIDFYNHSLKTAPEAKTKEEVGKVKLKIQNMQDNIIFNLSFIDFFNKQK